MDASPPAKATAPTTLITGAAGGIGQALVHAFVAAGYKVLATDRVTRPGDLACPVYVELDLYRFVNDEPFAARKVEELRECVGESGLNVLINNAAIQIMGGASALQREDWDRTLAINLVAPFLLVQAFLVDLERARGSVINVGSIHARLTKPDFVAYATSKGGLAALTKALAVDLGSRVRVNAIEPAAIETDMLSAGFEDDPESYDALAECHPRQCIGTPGEVARLCLAIADGRMNFLHGACIALDGGVGNRLHDPN